MTHEGEAFKVRVLGIIAGNGDMPALIAQEHIHKGGKCCIASIGDFESLKLACVERNLDKNIAVEKFPIGKVGAILDYFARNMVQDVVIIGGIARPNLGSIAVDFAGGMLLARMMKARLLGDDKLLRVIVEYLEEKGFNVISPVDVLSNHNYYQDFCKGALSPSARQIHDIEVGREVLRALGGMDVGQSVIVSDGYVLGIEAAEGTDALIARCARLRRESSGGVLVKMIKSHQDIRVDIPAIGPGTIEMLASYKFSGLAIDSKVMIINPDLVQQHVIAASLFFQYI
jgi:DUF1009 family protein